MVDERTITTLKDDYSIVIEDIGDAQTNEPVTFHLTERGGMPSRQSDSYEGEGLCGEAVHGKRPDEYSLVISLSEGSVNEDQVCQSCLQRLAERVESVGSAQEIVEVSKESDY